MSAAGWALVALGALLLAFTSSAAIRLPSKFVKSLFGVLWPFFVVMGLIAGWKFYAATHSFYVVGWGLAVYFILILFGPFAFHGDSSGEEEQA